MLTSSSFISHLLTRQSLGLICNLLFITKRQSRDWEKQITWSLLSPSTAPQPLITIIQKLLCGENKWNDCLLLYRRGGKFVFCAEFECRLAIQSTQAMAASCIVQIIMHGRDQIKIYQLWDGILLQISFLQMKNWKCKSEHVLSLLLICSVIPRELRRQIGKYIVQWSYIYIINVT